MNTGGGEGTGTWKKTGLRFNSAHIYEHLLCARPRLGSGEERQIRGNALPEGVEGYTLCLWDDKPSLSKLGCRPRGAECDA